MCVSFLLLSFKLGSGCLFSPHHVNQGGVQKVTPQVTVYEPHTAEESLRRRRSGMHSQLLPYLVKLLLQRADSITSEGLCQGAPAALS